jgi:hypothetical protein
MDGAFIGYSTARHKADQIAAPDSARRSDTTGAG